MTPLPRGVVSPMAKKLEDFLNSRVKGQERAIRYLREHMEMHWADLKNPRRPIANLLLIGPSGVGKTELVKALAEYFFGKPNRFTTIDCTEFEVGFEVTALKGAPPAYKGHGDAQPLLTQWKIDKYHAEALAENGEFFEEWIKKQGEVLVRKELAMKGIKQKIDEVEIILEKLQESEKKMVEEFNALEKRLKDKSSANQGLDIRKKLDKAIAEILAEFNALMKKRASLYEVQETVNSQIEKLKEKISAWKKLQKASPEQRLKAFKELVADGDYSYASGRYMSIVLWDEIEKAGSQIHDLLLPIMDEARLKLHDPPNAEVDFRNCINIFTSNLGSDNIAQEMSAVVSDSGPGRIGFSRAKPDLEAKELKGLDKTIYDVTQSEIKRFFRPEFVNRIDKIIVFRPLDEKAMHDILDLRIEELNQRQPIKFEIDPEVKKLLVQETMKRWSEGARLLQRRLDQFINTEIAPLMNTNALKEGDVVIVKLGPDRKLEFYKKD